MENLISDAKGISCGTRIETGGKVVEGSAGTLNKLKETLVENVVYFDEEDYSVWLERYKGEYLRRFRSWLNEYA